MNLTLQYVIEQATDLPMTEIKIALRPPLEIQGSNLYDVWADGRHLIAKEWTKPRELHDNPRREFYALQALVDLDIAPRPVFFDPAVAPIVVYEFMDGEMWDRQKPSAQQLTLLANAWLVIHKVPIDNALLAQSHGAFSVKRLLNRYRRQFRSYVEWAERCYTPGLLIVPYCEELIRKMNEVVIQLDSLPPPVLCFSRADPRFANVIQRPDGRIGLIDWEDSGWRDPAHDAADLLVHPNNEDLLTAEDWQAFLHPFLAERELVDSCTSTRIHLYRAIFPTFWLAALLSLGAKRAESDELAGWTVNGMGPNHRLRRYLARGLAWPEEAELDNLTELEEIKFFPIP